MTALVIRKGRRESWKKKVDKTINLGEEGGRRKVEAGGAAGDNVVYLFYEEKSNLKADYVYKRCYVDNQGNFVEPRTSWDLLLKYCHPWATVMTASEGDRRMATPVPVMVKKKVKLERAQRARLAQIHWMEAQYLKAKERKRRKKARKRIHELEAQYLELRRAHDDL